MAQPGFKSSSNSEVYYFFHYSMPCWSGMMSGGRETVKKFPSPLCKEDNSVAVSKGHVAMLLIGDCHIFCHHFIILLINRIHRLKWDTWFTWTTFWKNYPLNLQGWSLTDGVRMPCISSCSEMKWKYTDFFGCHWHFFTRGGLYPDQ